MAVAKPLLVVHVIHHLVIGGMENGVVNLINCLPRDDFHHAVICIEDYSDFSQRITRPDVVVYALHRSRIGITRLRWRLWRLLRQLRPDIVHSRNLSGLDALLPARLAGIKTIHSEHGFDVDNLSGNASKPTLLRRLHAPLVCHYVVVSQDLRRLMVERWGIKGGRVTQIYNGVDTTSFYPIEPKRHGLLPHALQGDGLFVVGAVGRIQTIKDQATLLRAFAVVLKHRPEWCVRLRCVVIGDGPLLTSLRLLAFDLGIERQTWFTGARHDVATLLQVLNLFILPSLNEGISNTLLEAMASGIPVLATSVGGNVELLDESVVGWTFAPGDHLALAQMIERYAGDAPLCVLHGAAARQRAVEHFSLESMVTNYSDLYKGL